MNDIAQGARGSIVYTDACNANVGEIAGQHKHLFVIINDLIIVEALKSVRLIGWGMI